MAVLSGEEVVSAGSSVTLEDWVVLKLSTEVVASTGILVVLIDGVDRGRGAPDEDEDASPKLVKVDDPDRGALTDGKAVAEMVNEPENGLEEEIVGSKTELKLKVDDGSADETDEVTKLGVEVGSKVVKAKPWEDEPIDEEGIGDISVEAVKEEVKPGDKVV
ncbi:unnamed protein product [Somion occarium]|uniref:Uncharacterized protein n=1 Tax=Somion occarium TaxID=3059160 RepID=A0ABP1D2N7_9APHY